MGCPTTPQTKKVYWIRLGVRRTMPEGDRSSGPEHNAGIDAEPFLLLHVRTAAARFFCFYPSFFLELSMLSLVSERLSRTGLGRHRL